MVCLQSVLRLLVTSNVPSSQNLVTLDDGGDTFLRNVCYYKSNIQEDGILHSHRLKTRNLTKLCSGYCVRLYVV
jgi:hypothetical protein